jgi:hypothetical protein
MVMRLSLSLFSTPFQLMHGRVRGCCVLQCSVMMACCCVLCLPLTTVRYVQGQSQRPSPKEWLEAAVATPINATDDDAPDDDTTIQMPFRASKSAKTEQLLRH